MGERKGVRDRQREMGERKESKRELERYIQTERDGRDR